MEWLYFYMRDNLRSAEKILLLHFFRYFDSARYTENISRPKTFNDSYRTKTSSSVWIL
jgi:hypothetical protein